MAEKSSLELPPYVIRAYLEKIAWRRQTMLAQRGNFLEKYPEDWVTAFLLSGKQFFDRDILAARKMELFKYQPRQMIGDQEGGGFRIFNNRKPNRRYLIGADPATGRTINNEDTDFCAAVVLDLETGEEMAAYRARIAPQDFALDLEEMGRHYNDALIAVERTGDGGTVILTLAGDCGYSNIYKHKEWHKRQRKVIEFEGFPTTPKTRPIALNMVAKMIREEPELIWDVQFIDEALVFVRNEKGIPAGAVGAHDDTVSARWVAHGARQVTLGWWEPWEARRERYGVDSEQAA